MYIVQGLTGMIVCIILFLVCPSFSFVKGSFGSSIVAGVCIQPIWKVDDVVRQRRLNCFEQLYLLYTRDIQNKKSVT